MSSSRPRCPVECVRSRSRIEINRSRYRCFSPCGDARQLLSFIVCPRYGRFSPFNAIQGDMPSLSPFFLRARTFTPHGGRFVFERALRAGISGYRFHRAREPNDVLSIKIA